MAVHQALMIPDWGPTTYFPQRLFEPDEEQAAQLAKRGVQIERSLIAELLGEAPELEAVRPRDGRTVPVKAIFTQSKAHMSKSVGGTAGLRFRRRTDGEHICVWTTGSRPPGSLCGWGCSQPDEQCAASTVDWK